MSLSPNAFTPVTYRSATPDDGPSICSIYQQGIDTGNATFSAEAPSWPEWDASHLQHSRIVAVEMTEVVGWAALSSVSGRCVYGGVAEVSVYVATKALGRGIGSGLLKTLIGESEANGIWTLQAGIFPENEASIALHQNLGFRIVGIREHLGRMTHGVHAGQWRNVALLERRSTIVGLGD